MTLPAWTYNLYGFQYDGRTFKTVVSESEEKARTKLLETHPWLDPSKLEVFDVLPCVEGQMTGQRWFLSVIIPRQEPK